MASTRVFNVAKIRLRAPSALQGEARTEAQHATMRALLRAAEHGWKATEGPNACFFVPSVHEPRIARTVQFLTGVDGVLWGRCSCPGGCWRQEVAYRPLPVPCWHVAAVLSLLFSQDRVELDDGLVIWKRPKPNPPAATAYVPPF